jgi:hypothetical protein
VILSWSPFYGALVVSGSRRTAIDTLWRIVPAADRTPARRRLTIALVDHIREYHQRTGRLAPEPDAERDEAKR